MDEINAFQLTGTGEKKSSLCNTIVASNFCFSCGNTEPLFYHCGRLLCPACNNNASQRAAGRIQDTLLGVREAYDNIGVNLGKVCHITLSPSEKDLKELSRKQLKKLAKEYLKYLGVYGGSMVRHEWRVLKKWKKKLINKMRVLNIKGGYWEGVKLNLFSLPSWLAYLYERPHFHILGFYPKIQWKSDDFKAKTGWIYKVHENFNSSDRKRDIFATAKYQLSHAAIANGRNAYSYFGVCAPKKTEVEKVKINVSRPCHCGSEEFFKIPCSPNQFEAFKSGEVVPDYPMSIADGGQIVSVRYKRTFKIYKVVLETKLLSDSF